MLTVTALLLLVFLVLLPISISIGRTHTPEQIVGKVKVYGIGCTFALPKTPPHTAVSISASRIPASAEQTVVSRSQEVSTDAEQILHDTVNRREPLELSGRRESPHLALTLSGRLMGDLRAVIRVLIGAVKHRRHHRATGGRVTAQLVGDQTNVWLQGPHG